MAKSQKRSGREPKKAKTAVKKPNPVVSVFSDGRLEPKKKKPAVIPG